MRISQINSSDIQTISSSVEKSEDVSLKTSNPTNEMTDQKGNPTEQAYQIATNKLNEFMEHTNRSSKFVFHKDLERYYVEVVDTKTDEVIKEVPPKELLDAYYEMQKLAGKIFDTQA